MHTSQETTIQGMKPRFLMEAISVVIVLFTLGTRCSDCDMKSKKNKEDIPKTAVETRVPFQENVDIPNAGNEVNKAYNGARTNQNRDFISCQSNMEQFYHTDSNFQVFDSLTSKKKIIRNKRSISSDDSNSPTTTTTVHGDSTTINIEPIATLEQAEVLILRDETKRFLNEFKNEMERDVVENHMLYCPHTPLCSFKYENIYLDRTNYKSPCATCLCENCDTTYLCCPDKVDFNKPRRSSNTDHECKRMSLRDTGNAYEIVTKCSSNPNSLANDPCSSDQNSDTFSDILPVTDNTTNKTYRNRKCAICNQVAKAKLVIWQPQLICVKTDAVQSMLKSEKDLIQFAKKSSYCDITYFMPDESVAPVICEQVVSVCNVTGNWPIYDHVFSTACSAYENIYTVDLGGFETKLYRYVSLIIIGFKLISNIENVNNKQIQYEEHIKCIFKDDCII